MNYLLIFENKEKQTIFKLLPTLNRLLEWIIYNYELVGSYFECYDLTYTKGTLPKLKFFDIKKEEIYKMELKKAIELYAFDDYGKLIEKELELIG